MNIIVLLVVLLPIANAKFYNEPVSNKLNSCNSTSSCGCQNGRDGRDGRDGVTIQGPPGRDGKDGNDGRDCIECARGPKGPKGDRGDAGKNGANGAPGKAGVAGAKGPKGDRGNNGSNGKDGSNGARGPPGPAGRPGVKGEKGVCDQSTLNTLTSTINSLKASLAKVNTELASTKNALNRINSQYTSLSKTVFDIKRTTVQVGSDHKIARGVLPSGYSDHTADELQWQSLHMAAAACCRAVTATGGSGSHPNRVYPRTKNMNCNQICATTPYRSCDAEMSIYGSAKKAKSQKDEVGWFSNHGCDDNADYGFEPMLHASDVFKAGTFISFCCCR